MSRRVVVALAVLATAVVAGAVTGLGRAALRDTSPSAQAQQQVTITVLAAASLAAPFTALAEAFEEEHPGVTVALGTGPSSTLAAQVAAGAPADVLATADERTMRTALGAVEPPDPPVVFARNTVALAVPGTDPAGVDGIDDLDRSDVTYAVCAPEVPCGAAAARVLDAAGVRRDPVTYESDVTAVLTKVRQGEVDAGLVYASDVHPASAGVLDGSVRAVPLLRDVEVTRYPVVVLPGDREALAQAFVDLLLSPEGERVLRDNGFLLP